MKEIRTSEQRPLWQKIPRGLYWGAIQSVNPFIDNHLDRRTYGNAFNPENYKLRFSSLERKIKERTALCLDLAYIAGILAAAGYLIYKIAT